MRGCLCPLPTLFSTQERVTLLGSGRSIRRRVNRSATGRALAKDTLSAAVGQLAVYGRVPRAKSTRGGRTDRETVRWQLISSSPSSVREEATRGHGWSEG